MSDVDFFQTRLNRLKTALGISKDKEAAGFLGLQEKAFNARKTRGSFPEKELYALAAKRPDLNLDVAYVLTGITAEAHGRLAALDRAVELAGGGTDDFNEIKARASQLMTMVGLNATEAALLISFRACPPADQDSLRKLASSLAGKNTSAPTAAPRQKTAPAKAAASVKQSNSGHVGGNMVAGNYKGK